MSRRTMTQGPSGGTGVPLAITYTRVSSDDQASEGTSLAAQCAECRRYVASKGWVIDSEFTDVMSGLKDARPSYQALLARVRELRAQGRSVLVVVAALDRFGRRLLERVRCREELKALGVSTHSVREGGEVNDMLAGFLAVMAEEEAKRLGMRISHTWADLANKGWFKCSAMLPWGYTSRPATPEERASGSPRTVIEPDPLSAPYVGQLFERVARGESTWSVARWAASLPADIRGAWVSGRGKTPDRELTRRSVSKILRNPVYVAPAPAQWEPIVDEITWRTVQQRLDARAASPRAKPSSYKLSGFLRCPDCGQKMNGEQAGKLRRYRCVAWRKGGAATPMCSATADAAQVEALVLAEVTDRVHAFVRTDRKHLERAWATLAKPGHSADNGRALRRLEHQVETARRRITEATRLFVDGSISKAAYDDMVASEQVTLDAAEGELARHSVSRPAETLPPLEQVLQELGGWTVDALAVRDVLALLLERVTPRRLRRGVYGLDEIAWSPLGAKLAEATLQAAA